MTRRIRSIDIARGLAILFMIWVHVLETYATEEVAKQAVFGKIIYFLGSAPSAPVFMTLMGISFMFSRHQDMKFGVQRGIKILLLAYVLNLCRYVIPVFIAKQINPIAIANWSEEDSNLLWLFLTSDILQLAGISLIIMSIVRRYVKNNWLILAIASVILLIAPFLWGLKIGQPVIDEVLNLFWGAENKAYFPVFPWLSFPLLGMFLGSFLANSQELNRTFKRIGLIGLPLTAIGLVISFTNPSYHFGDYYHPAQGGMIYMIGFVMFWLWICNEIVNNFPRNRLLRLFDKWSKDVTSIYFIQWCIIEWLAYIVGYQDKDVISTIFLMVSIALSSHFINQIYQKYRQASSVKLTVS
jgi:uncharacterized membrane protein